MSLPSPPCCSLLSSFLFVPPCYCSSSWVLLAQDTLHDSSWLLDGKGFFLPPICFHTCLLVCSQLVSLFLYLHCDSILLSGCFRSKESPCLPFLTSLSIAQCSSFWWLWGQDSSPICFGTRLSTSLSHVAVLSGCFRGTVCSLSSCSLQLVPLLLSLSLAVLLSRCLFGHTILSGSSFVLPCPRLFPPTCILNSFLIAAAAWENGFPGLLCFSLTFLPLFRSHSLTLGLYHMLPYLPSYLSPYPLSTTVLLSRSPAFGTERVVFLLFPFFPSLSL